MKIISGILKGRKLEGFDIKGTRPTMDRVKESVFAMIQNELPNSICLDLFSGSGNLGIEAISQGAKKAYLVDINKKAIEVIKRNIENLNIKEKVVICNTDYQKLLMTWHDDKIDVLFLDPPYQTDYIEKAIKLITKYNVLSEKGIIICESSDLDKVIYDQHYQAIKTKKYGDKWVVILKKI